jgi:hypothetical protein
VRYFVIARGDEVIGSHIVAEVVRERSDDGRYRDVSLAGSLAGVGMSILSDVEIDAWPGGRELLARWRAGDDSRFDQRTEDLEVQADGPGFVHVVAPEVPMHHWLTVKRSRALIEQARRVAGRARMLRVELTNSPTRDDDAQSKAAP